MTEFLPETASPNDPARVWYMSGDSKVLWQAVFTTRQPIPYYRGLDPLPGPYTVHLEWTEK